MGSKFHSRPWTAFGMRICEKSVRLVRSNPKFGNKLAIIWENEHPPAMQSAMGWCKHGYINQMVELASHRFQVIAGRSNIF